jgi:3-deoxy-D-manno-octulosonic-acid transferase
MINHYDIAYGVGVGITAPLWLAHPGARKKVFRAFSQRMGRGAARDLSKPAIMVHAVSLGEINATRALIEVLRRERPGMDFIVSVTTETGFARGMEIYGKASDVTLVRYPLDFTPAVDRMLTALRPAVVALLELEVWPNFIRRCTQRKVPVVLINGRITEGSFRKYRMARPIVGSMFARLTHVAAQDETYAKRFAELGAAEKRISVTGTMKFDTAAVEERLAGQEELAREVGLEVGKELIWVCGSTGPGEEEIVLWVYGELVKKFAGLRVVIVPRKPERFEEVAGMILEKGFGLVRRSAPTLTLPRSTRGGEKSAVVLGDTIGELRKFYALGDVVFVGRTLVDLGHRQHGSDMIEPAALGKAVVVGPFTGNFAEAMNCFRETGAMIEVQTAGKLQNAIEGLLSDRARAKEMGEKAREVVRANQGATERHARLILDTLDSVPTMSAR